jgi:hypothetical protein
MPAEMQLESIRFARFTPGCAEGTMRYTRVISLCVVLSLSLYVSACSGRPTQIIQLTEQARQEAVNEHADQFAVDYWTAGEKAWGEASSKLDAQKWGEAETLLLKAKSSYIHARDMAKDQRAAAITQITQAQQTATLRLKALKEDRAVSKLSAARKKEFDAAVKQFEDNIAKAAEQFKNAQYTDSNSLFQRTTREIWEAQQEYLKK